MEVSDHVEVLHLHINNKKTIDDKKSIVFFIIYFVIFIFCL